MKPEYYNFDEPVHQSYNLKADWACFYDGAAMTLTQLSGSGTLRVWNKWNGPVIFQTPEETIEVEAGHSKDFQLTEQTIGTPIAIGANDDTVFQDWSNSSFVDPDTETAQTRVITYIGHIFCELIGNNNDVRMGLHFKKPTSFFLQDGGTTASDGFFSGFCRGEAISQITADAGIKLFDLSTITTVGNEFFALMFTHNTNITELPEGSFDTSNIVMTVPPDGAELTKGQHFFQGFNEYGALSALPAGSFNISKITCAPDMFFTAFNQYGALTSLPAGSFVTTQIVENHGWFFCQFNDHGALTSLPSGSFNLTGLQYSYQPHDELFNSFNSAGELDLLPEGSFAMTNYRGIKKGYDSDPTYHVGYLPAYSFSEFTSRAGKLRLLPAGSFVFPNITGLETSCFNAFAGINAQDWGDAPGPILQALPSGSFRFPNVVEIQSWCFNSFIESAKNIHYLPSQSFRFPSVTKISPDYVMRSFANNSGLLALPSGGFNISTNATLTSSGTCTYLWGAFVGTTMAPSSSGVTITALKNESILDIYDYGCSGQALCGYVSKGGTITFPSGTGNSSGSTP